MSRSAESQILFSSIKCFLSAYIAPVFIIDHADSQRSSYNFNPRMNFKSGYGSFKKHPAFKVKYQLESTERRELTDLHFVPLN